MNWIRAPAQNNPFLNRAINFNHRRSSDTVPTTIDISEYCREVISWLGEALFNLVTELRDLFGTVY